MKTSHLQNIRKELKAIDPLKLILCPVCNKEKNQESFRVDMRSAYNRTTECLQCEGRRLYQRKKKRKELTDKFKVQ